jgi:hypothetical protein
MAIRKAQVALTLVLSVLLLGLVWSFGPLRYLPGPSPAETERNLQAKLAPGMDNHQVIAYLDREHIEHSAYMPEQQTILAIRRDTCHMVLVECNTEITINFDQRGRLVSIESKAGFTGL